MKPNATSKPFFDAQTIAAAIAAAPDRVEDPDCPYDPNDAAAVEAFWENAIVSHSYAELKEKLAARREQEKGPGKSPRKMSTTIRFDADVLTALRATGKGWQTRVNEVMREWVKTHSA
jgi:uncharacterized protein (DUF4415 family)